MKVCVCERDIFAHKLTVAVPCRFHGDEDCWRDAAYVRCFLHPKVIWWRQVVLGRLLRVRQDHAQGKDTALS